MRRDQMGIELMKSLGQIDHQIEEVNLEAQKMDLAPWELRTPDGNWALAPLLVSRAQVLHGILLLQPATRERLENATS